MTSIESMLNSFTHNDNGERSETRGNIMAIMAQKVWSLIHKHYELVKFALVGLTTMVVDICVFYSLTLTFMGSKPTLAKIIAGTIAMCVSYLLNTMWSFNNRRGRSKHHEAILFFLISTIGIGIGAAPEFFVTNFTQWRSGTHSLLGIIMVDFVLNYIVGNFAQMIFRFWALRRFAYPETLADTVPSFTYDSIPEEISPVAPANDVAKTVPYTRISPRTPRTAGSGSWNVMNFLRPKQRTS